MHTHRTPSIFDRLLQRSANWKAMAFTFIVSVAINYLLIFRLGWGDIYSGLHRPVAQCLATIAGNLLIGGLGFILFGPTRIPRPSRAAWLVLAAAVLVLCLIIGHVVLGGYLHAADEYAYLFEAQTFQQGRLWNPPPPLGQAQTASYVWIVGAKWVAQYPPGWPGFLALVGLVSPSYILAPALLLVATTLGLGELVRQRAGSKEALLAALIFALSPFALFNGASLFSHTMAACLGILAMLASREAAERHSLRFALLSGALIGLLAITRNVSAIVYALAVVADQFRRPGWCSRFVLIGIGGVPFIAGLIAYQYRVTGDPFMPVYWFAGRKVDHLYFDLPNIKIGISTAIKNVVEITTYTNPLFVAAWLTSMIILGRQKQLAPVDMVYPLGIILFLFYPLYAGDRFGPRYNFDFWPPAVATIGAALPAMQDSMRKWFRQALMLSTVSGFGVCVVLGFYWHAITMDTFDAFRVIDAARLHQAVVCLKSGSGRVNLLNPFNFPRNGIRSDGEVIRLRCEATTLANIHKAYPGRTVWAYVRAREAPSGHLERM